MAIYTITGQPRNGKSLRVVKELYKLKDENDKLEKQGKPRRKIYIDIAGINSDDVDVYFDDCITDLTKEQKETIWFGKHDDPEKPNNLWCPPYNSIFIFDECHKLDFVKDVSGSLSKNPSTISLNEHGHAGHIIYFITQFPQFIHTHIRGLTAEHWHVKKKFNLPMAKVYKWDDFKLNPRAEVNLEDASTIETFLFLPKYKKAYISATSHEKQPFKPPMVLILPIIILLIIGAFLWSRKDNSVLLNKPAQNEPTIQVIESLEQQNQQQLEQINKIRFELEELKAKYLPKHIAELAEHEDVRPAMIISSSEHCRVYNSHGEALIIADGLCRMMNEYPSMIPKSRQATKVSDTLPKPNQPIFDNQNVNIKEFNSQS